MDDFSPYVPNVHFEQIPIKNLVSNQQYQRNLSQAHVEKTAVDFDVYQINPVKVSRRNGVNYVFDGQHTIEIVALVSGSRETPVWCMIYDDLNYKHEADIFANQQKYVRELSPLEVFSANIEACNDTQLTIKSLVESLGLSIGNCKAPGVIRAVATLEKIFLTYGYHVLSRTLTLLIGTWEGDVDSLSGSMMSAVARLVSVFKDELDDELFVEKLSTVSVKHLMRNAKERRPGSMGYAEVMILEYNGKKKNDANKLQLSRLYERKHTLHKAMDESVDMVYDDRQGSNNRDEQTQSFLEGIF